MHVRSVLALAGVAGLLAVPFAVASPDDGPVQSATGGIHWTIPLPNPFGVEVRNQPLSFTAAKDADGNVTGHFTYHQVVEGESFNFGVDVTCMNISMATGPRSEASSGRATIRRFRRACSPGSRSSTTAKAPTTRRIGRASSDSGTRPPTRRSATVQTYPASAPGMCKEMSRCSRRRFIATEASAVRPRSTVLT
jgi:hypothetical protein